MTATSQTLLTVGNIYVDHNVFGVNSGKDFRLDSGKDYFGDDGERVLGGSAVNVAMQARRLDLAVGFVGKTGDDAGADEVRALLKAQQITTDLMVRQPGLISSMAINLVATNGEFIGVHYGNASKRLAVSDFDLSTEAWRQVTAVYFGGTAKQPLLFAQLAELFAELAGRGVKLFYDPNRFPAAEAPADQKLLRQQLKHVGIYFPNHEELLQATNTASTEAGLAAALNAGVKVVALKLGAKGCRVVTADQDFTVAARPVAVKTTVGAGDCFNASFMSSYLAGQSLRHCAEQATTAAAIRVSQNIWPDRAMIDGFN